MLIVKCPGCKNQMRCNPVGKSLSGKSKRCVYCGRSFRIKGNIIQQL